MKTRTGTRGYFSILLHAHLPFVRHPEHQRFLEEQWFFEAMTETYLPLLAITEQMIRDGVDFRMSWSITPTLLSMLEDELLKDRYQQYVEKQVELAERELVRQRFHEEYKRVAQFYLGRYRLLAELYLDTYQRDLVRGFRRLQDQGRVEILASAATHAFLPLAALEPSSIRAQVSIGVEEYRKAFGRDPQGFWLPECGYFPGLDEVLAEAGVRYFVVESHAALNGSTRARYGVHAPIVCPSGVAAFPRDPQCTRQVWSSQDGFPGDPEYREFYRDIGFDLPIEYVGPYIGPDGVRTQTGIKYMRVTGPTDEKKPYVRQKALNKAAQHALLFAQWREQQVAWLESRMDRRPLILAPYDAELFGHWWFEGPEWINFLLRRLVPGKSTVVSATPSEYLAEYPTGQQSRPSASSWGFKGYNEVWLNGQNDWLYPELHLAGQEMQRLARQHRGAKGARRRALNQACRELLLAQASDWAFIMKAGTATGYARQRAREHLESFQALATSVRKGVIDETMVADLESKNNLFPDLSFEVYGEVPSVQDESGAQRPLHVAFLVAEMAPLVKVGGLADVAGALPPALAARGARITIFLPGYRSIDRENNGFHPIHEGLAVPMGPVAETCRLLESTKTDPGVRLILVENERYFDREGIYVDSSTREEYRDNAERFTFFTRAALEGLRVLGHPVDIIHCHDHQTALAPAYLRIQYRDDRVLGGAASVYTLHNLGYQGIHCAEILEKAGFGIHECYPGSYFEYYGSVNYMKVGICFADKVSTVSETYAREICEDEGQSAGLAPVINTRREDLVGILNGIDVDVWSPAKDPHIPAHFDAEHLEGKKECKRALLQTVGLSDTDLEVPLIGMITRLVDQKGLDLVEESLDRILKTGSLFILLGSGLPKYEEFFTEAMRRYPDQCVAMIKFDNALAHLIEAGCDIFLMPSLYEPCGLNQMYSLRYGTVPVVRTTGGLADTVKDADAYEDGVGFSFTKYTSEAMLQAIERALDA
ncbi:MAG: DUF1957 domain-containing protein, partial [Planctomycetes bacterium]|nr:DUF1957 domain-containing protein [Planctomycetota bacterium]